MTTTRIFTCLLLVSAALGQAQPPISAENLAKLKASHAAKKAKLAELMAKDPSLAAKKAKKPAQERPSLASLSKSSADLSAKKPSKPAAMLPGAAKPSKPVGMPSKALMARAKLQNAKLMGTTPAASTPVGGAIPPKPSKLSKPSPGAKRFPPMFASNEIKTDADALQALKRRSGSKAPRPPL